MSLFKCAGIKSVRRSAVFTVAVAMILAAGSAFAAETPVPEGPSISGPPLDRPPVIDPDKAEAFWEDLIEESEEDNDQLAADNSVPP